MTENNLDKEEGIIVKEVRSLMKKGATATEAVLEVMQSHDLPIEDVARYVPLTIIMQMQNEFREKNCVKKDAGDIVMDQILC